MKRRGVAFSLSVSFLVCSLAPQALGQSSSLPRANAVVKPHAYVSLEPVPRGRLFQVAVVAEILPGFHVNANKVLQEHLIPTTLQADLPAGLRLIEVAYPPGKLQKFAFSQEKLSVYEGTFTLRMKLEAKADAPLGTARLPLTLRYQACNDELCLPPVKLPIAVQLEIAPVGTKARATYPEIFRGEKTIKTK